MTIPIEPSHAARAAGTPAAVRCDACKAYGTQTEHVKRGGFDLIVCVDPADCRQRAQALGIWAVTR